MQQYYLDGYVAYYEGALLLRNGRQTEAQELLATARERLGDRLFEQAVRADPSIPSSAAIRP